MYSEGLDWKRNPALVGWNAPKTQAILYNQFKLSFPELAGCAGTGKTQFCLQLCANVQIPSELDGLSGKAIYLDTEGAFHAERMKQIAQATKINVLQMIAAQKERMEDETAATFENRDFMDNILYKKIDSVDSLIHTLESLDQSILSHHPDVKLLILDR